MFRALSLRYSTIPLLSMAPENSGLSNARTRIQEQVAEGVALHFMWVSPGVTGCSHCVRVRTRPRGPFTAGETNQFEIHAKNLEQILSCRIKLKSAVRQIHPDNHPTREANDNYFRPLENREIRICEGGFPVPSQPQIARAFATYFDSPMSSAMFSANAFPSLTKKAPLPR